MLAALTFMCGQCRTPAAAKNGSLPLPLDAWKVPVPCGGVVFFHLGKASGSQIECFLSEQPEFACCYRGECGVCHGGCQHRSLIDTSFRLPEGLLNNATLRSKMRFVTSYHSFPIGPTPGMGHDVSALEHFGLLRARAKPAGCRVLLLTVLRHPASQLVSAWHYSGRVPGKPNATFEEWLGTRQHEAFNGIPFAPLQVGSWPVSPPHEEVLRSVAWRNIRLMESEVLGNFDVVRVRPRLHMCILPCFLWMAARPCFRCRACAHR